MSLFNGPLDSAYKDNKVILWESALHSQIESLVEEFRCSFESFKNKVLAS